MKELRRKYHYYMHEDEDEYDAISKREEEQQKWIILRWTKQQDVKEILIPADAKTLKAIADFLISLSVKKY